MLKNFDYKLRSLFLKLDRRDYKSSKILSIFYRFLNPIKYFRQLFLNVISENEKSLIEEGYKQFIFESENLSKVIERSNTIINNISFYKELDKSKKEFLQSYKIDFLNKETIFI